MYLHSYNSLMYKILPFLRHLTDPWLLSALPYFYTDSVLYLHNWNNNYSVAGSHYKLPNTEYHTLYQPDILASDHIRYQDVLLH